MGGIVDLRALNDFGDAFPLAWVLGFASPRVEEVYNLDI